MNILIQNLCRLLICILLLGASTGCSFLDDENHNVTENMYLNRTELTLAVGNTETLYITAGEKIFYCTWKSSDISVATVSNDGMVYAVSEGEAVITVSVNGIKNLNCRVTVIDITHDVILDALSAIRYIELLDTQPAGDYTVRISGDITSEQLCDISFAVQELSYTYGAPVKVFLDLSQTTGLDSIDSSTFAGCTALSGVNLSNCVNLKSIGDCAFQDCTSLTDVNLSGCSNLTDLGLQAFYNCTSLLTVDLSGCVSLSDIKIYTFGYCSVLTEIDLSDCTSMINMGYGVFMNCSSLHTIVLPDSLEKIENAVFSCTALSTITLPAGLQEIGANEFGGCTMLQTVYVNAYDPPVFIEGSYDFEKNIGFPDSVTIYVPSYAVDNYKNTAGWSVYADQIQEYM